MNDKPNVTFALEELIDQSSLLHVLTGLELVCLEKAEHICTNWQDTATARPWKDAAKHIGKILAKIEV